ncbi:bifunctional alpha/beta hydrolase/OsmC family protein [Archangium violaceum]|uniref:bifunctional alpha/beta hydrolase/OsmC family protein n=1 Tax=Archangium violaceum TaxID=83451 RepID=UPI001EF682AD|nr:alpha/beta fold hydrolase [Archangium violaceum]
MSFRGARGRKLEARLDLPARKPVAYVLFTHCFTCGGELFPARAISQALTEHGLGVLRFDFTEAEAEAHAEPQHDFTDVGDVRAAVDYLRKSHEAPRLLIGHSLGGTAVLRVASEIPEVKAVATLGAPFTPSQVHGLLAPVLREAEREGETRVRLGAGAMRISRHFLEELSEERMEECVGQPGRALLVMHAPADGVVGMGNARRIYEAARQPKSFVALEGADHLLSGPEDARFVAAVLGAWAGRYVGAREVEEQRESQPELSQGKVEVSEAGEGAFAQDIRVGRHRLRADEPTAYGGLDTGPSPYGLLAAALGACTAMTLRLYARKKGWPLERVSVTLNHGKVHAEDCQHCETKEGMVDRIDRRVKLEGPLSEDQRRRLLEIADRCPVHRSLESEIDVHTLLEEDETPTSTTTPLPPGEGRGEGIASPF